MGGEEWRGREELVVVREDAVCRCSVEETVQGFEGLAVRHSELSGRCSAATAGEMPEPERQ